MLIAKREGTVLVTSENGYGKRSLLDAYRTQSRGGKGVYTMKKTTKTGQLVTILETTDDDDLMIITNAGVMIRQKVDLIRVIGRNTQGVKLIRLDDGSKISSVTKVINDTEETDETDESENTNNNIQTNEEGPETIIE